MASKIRQTNGVRSRNRKTVVVANGVEGGLNALPQATVLTIRGLIGSPTRLAHKLATADTTGSRGQFKVVPVGRDLRLIVKETAKEFTVVDLLSKGAMEAFGARTMSAGRTKASTPVKPRGAIQAKGRGGRVGSPGLLTKARTVSPIPRGLKVATHETD